MSSGAEGVTHQSKLWEIQVGKDHLVRCVLRAIAAHTLDDYVPKCDTMNP